MLAYTFVGMYIRWQGLPTIATNIGPPRNMMIQKYLKKTLKTIKANSDTFNEVFRMNFFYKNS